MTSAITPEDWALITGASAGIGEEFARQLAARGMNLILVARREDKLANLADQLETQHGVQVQIARIDLYKESFLNQIEQACQDLVISLFICNAGHPSHMGSFIDRPIHEIEVMLRFNTQVQVKLVHHFARLMADHQHGGIIMVGSYAGYGPIPYMAEYSACKAYQLTFGEALHYELKASGVDLLVLSPGATKTERIHFGMPVESVARAALEALGKKPSVIPGFKNRLTIWFGRYFKTRRKYINDYGCRINRLKDRWDKLASNP